MSGVISCLIVSLLAVVFAVWVVRSSGIKHADETWRNKLWDRWHQSGGKQPESRKRG